MKIKKVNLKQTGINLTYKLKILNLKFYNKIKKTYKEKLTNLNKNKQIKKKMNLGL